MKNLMNIENAKNADGTRTGYDAGGRSWRILGVSGNWRAYASVTRSGSKNSLLCFRTLTEISEELLLTGLEEQK